MREATMKIKHLDKALAFLALIAGIITAVVAGILTDIRIALIGLVPIIGAVIYLRAIRSQDNLLAFSKPKQERLYKLLNILFFISFIYSLYSLQTVVYGRTAGYLIATIVMSITIPLIILTLPKGNKYLLLTLGQILVVSMSLRLSVFYGSSGVMWDLWRHFEIIEPLITNGRIPLGFYESFPLMHLLIGETSIITLLGLKDSVMASILFTESISIIFIFLLVKDFYTAKAGLLCAFLLAITSVHIMWGFLSTPQTMVLSLAPLILYTLYKATQQHRASYMSIVILLFITVVFTHPLSALIIWTTLLGVYLFDRFFQKIQTNTASYFTFGMLVLAVVIMLSQFMYTWVLGFGVKSVRDWLLLGSTWKYLSAVNVPQNLLFHIWDSLGVYTLIALAVVGGLYFSSEKRSRFFAIAACSALLLVIARLGDPLQFYSALPYRWMPFIMVLLVVPAGIGFLLLANMKNRAMAITSIIILAVIIPASMLATSSSNDSFNRELNLGSKSVRASFMESELRAIDTMYEITTPEQTFVIDFLVWSKEENRIRGRTENPVEFYLNKNMDSVGSSTIIVLREDMRHEPFLLLKSSDENVYTVLDYDPKALLDSSHDFDFIYSVGTVYLYQKRG